MPSSRSNRAFSLLTVPDFVALARPVNGVQPDLARLVIVADREAAR